MKLIQHFAMGNSSQDEHRAFPPEHPDPVYLRFGHWPADERSRNHVTGDKEHGVSVYDLDKHGDPMDPDEDMDRGGMEPDWGDDFAQDEFGNDTHDEMHDRVHRAEQARRRGGFTQDLPHLVKGDLVGYGHDDEPLLNNVRRVGDWIDHRHLFVPGAEKHHLARDENDPDYEEPEEPPTHHTAALPTWRDPNRVRLNPGKQRQHDILLHEHLIEYHPEILMQPPALHDALHRAAHTDSGQGYGSGQYGQPSLLGLDHPHHPLIDPALPKAQRLASSNDLPQEWKDHIESFRPIAKAYGLEDPETAHGACLGTTGLFQSHVRKRLGLPTGPGSGNQNADPEAGIAWLHDHHVAPPKRAAGAGGADGTIGEHEVLHTPSGHVIDWTARQFDPDADFPHVEREETFAKRWRHYKDEGWSDCVPCQEANHEVHEMNNEPVDICPLCKDKGHHHTAARERPQRWQPEPPPEGLHSAFRGLYLGGDTKGEYVPPGPDGGIGSQREVPADHSDQGILDKMQRHHEWKNRGWTGLETIPESQKEPWKMYGPHWTKDSDLAHQFAFDIRHGQYRGGRFNEQTPTNGVVLEAQSRKPFDADALGSQYGESETKWPGRSNIERVIAHVHRYDPAEHGPFHQARAAGKTYVRSFEIPAEHIKRYAKQAALNSQPLPIEHVLDMASGDYDSGTKVRDVVGPMRDHYRHWDRPFNTKPVHVFAPTPDSDDGPMLVNGHHRVTHALVLGHPTIDAVVHHPQADEHGDWDYPTYFDLPNIFTAAKDVDDIMDLLGPGVKPAKAPDPQADADRDERIRQHQEWQATRKGYSPGDDLSDWKGYPHAEWVPIGVAQHFRDHTGNQHSGSQQVVDNIAGQLKAGRGMTDPLMLLHHNEEHRALLGEGNHRLAAAEKAGWTHVPMRVVRMYDGEAERGKGKVIPHAWRGTLQGRTPELAKPSEVLSPGAVGMRKQAANAAKQWWHLTDDEHFQPSDDVRPLGAGGRRPARGPALYVTTSPHYWHSVAGGSDGDAWASGRRWAAEIEPNQEVHEPAGSQQGLLRQPSRATVQRIIPVEHAIAETTGYFPDGRSVPLGWRSAYSGEHEEGGGERRRPGLDQSRGRIGRALSRLRRLRADSGSPGQGDLRPLTWHPKALKEYKRLDKPAKKAVDTTLEGLQRGDPNLQTHALSGALKGWSSTKASRGHRIVHQRSDDGGIYIGGVSLHEYPNQRFSAVEAATRTVTEADGSNYDGVMIAFVPPAWMADALVLDDGTESQDNLHVTLAYLGNQSEYTSRQLRTLPEVVAGWAQDQRPVTARTQGAGTFVPAEEDGKHVVWASVDIPEGHRLHVTLVDHLRATGYAPHEDHSWTPHITLTYRNHAQRFLPKVTSQEWEIDEVWVCIGGRWQSLPLGR